MTDELKPCPNGCSSSGEVWNGEGLEVCPVCHGNTVVPTPAAPQEGAPETIWAWTDKEYDAKVWNDHGDARYTPTAAVPHVPKADLEAWEMHFYALKGRTNKRIAELNAKLATARDEALEEAEKGILEEDVQEIHTDYDQGYDHAWNGCLEVIRALKTKDGE